MDKPQQEPKIVGTVSVVLAASGQVGVNVMGGISQLTALGLLAAAQRVVLDNPPKEQRRIVPVSVVPNVKK